MSYYVYGFRRTGDAECRYVGMTSQAPEKRLAYLAGDARRYSRILSRRKQVMDPESFPAWLLNNEIETFKIAKVETEQDARATERAIVALILRLDHRIFNRQLVPKEKWQPEWCKAQDEAA